MEATSYFDRLAILDSFLDILVPETYTALPDGWWVAMSDVTGSTAAIDAGRYKEVNALGAITIMAVLNLVGSFRIPFMFGGDGALVCIPPDLYESTRKALAGVRQIARTEFALDLRIGMVPIADIRSKGADIGVARLRISDYFEQPVFNGAGVALAEAWVKDGTEPNPYLVMDAGRMDDADMTGLECRWQHIPSRKDEIVALIVESESTSEYEDVIRTIGDIYGSDEHWKPIDETLLRFTVDLEKLSVENRIRNAGKSLLTRLRYYGHLLVMNAVGASLMKRNVRTQTTDWGAYKRDLSQNTDFKKFDGVIRLVMSGTAAQRERLEEWLSIRYSQRRLVYGLNSSPSAMITCLLFGYMKNHIHFVDGSAGGYTKAAAALKRRKRAWLDAAALQVGSSPVGLVQARDHHTL